MSVMSLLDMSVAGGVFILAVAVVRAIFVNRLPKAAFLVLWAVAALRLLAPVSVPSAVSVYSLWRTDSAPTVQTAQATDTGSAEDAAWTAPETAAAPAARTPEVQVRTGVELPRRAIIWAVGAVGFGGYFALAYLHSRRKFREAIAVEDDFIAGWQKRHRLRRRVSVRLSGVVSAPLTYGLIRPVILLPASTDWRDRERLEFILAHEYVHIRRFDGAAKLILTAAVCLHWFNPAAWVMYVLANRDMELSCDERVVRAIGPDARAAYARTLIAMEEARTGLAPLVSHFSKNAMEERITAIMKTKKMTVLAVVMSVLLVTGMTAVFATAPKAAAAPEDDLAEEALEEQDDLGISAAAITDGQLEQIATLQPEGWEDMTVSDYRAFVRGMVEGHGLDFADLQAMLTDLAHTGEISALRDRRDDIYFLCYLAEPLLCGNWEEITYFHYFVSGDYPWPANNACIDLSIGIQVRQPDIVTLADYDMARRELLDEYTRLVTHADEQTLKDADALNKLVDSVYVDAPEGMIATVMRTPARRLVTDTTQKVLKVGETVIIGTEEMPEQYNQTNRVALTCRDGGTFEVSVPGPGGEAETVTIGGGETVLVYLHANGDESNIYDITVQNVGTAASQIAYSYDIFVAGQVIKTSSPSDAVDN